MRLTELSNSVNISCHTKFQDNFLIFKGLGIIWVKQLTQTQTHPLHDLYAYLNLPRNMKSTIFYNNEHTNIIISKSDITPEECSKNLSSSAFTLPSPHNTSVLGNTTKLLTLHRITFTHQNKHYHVICVKNWHTSEPTNYHSCKVAYIQ